VHIRRRDIFLLLLLTLMLQFAMGCSSSAQSIQGERWVIFPGEQAQEQGIGSWIVEDGQTAEYWSPSENNILTLEKQLGAYLQNNSDRFDKQKSPIGERLDEYDRQYTGMVLGEKKIIFANYFCDSLAIDWRTEFVFVLDGGDCFFQFKYDVNSGAFLDLQVNGIA
jgi:hypothetical protein